MERRTFLMLGVLLASGYVLEQVTQPYLLHALDPIRYDQLRPPFTLDVQSQNIYAKLSDIIPKDNQTSMLEHAYAQYFIARKNALDEARLKSLLRLKAVYIPGEINRKEAKFEHVEVGATMCVASPFGGLDASIQWGFPGYRKLQNNEPIDETDAVSIMAHEALGHTHRILSIYKNLKNQGKSDYELANTFTYRDVTPDDEKESWCTELLVAHLYQKAHPDLSYNGYFRDPLQTGIDELGFIKFWFPRQQNIQEFAWTEKEMQWFLERNCAISVLRGNYASQKPIAPPFLPLTIRDAQLDTTFVKTVPQFFIPDERAAQYGVSMDPTETNPWIQRWLKI
jgi:hypothetical protein